MLLPKKIYRTNDMKKVFIHSWSIKTDPSNLDLDDQRLKTMTVEMQDKT
jgi:hypothetical protein